MADGSLWLIMPTVLDDSWPRYWWWRGEKVGHEVYRLSATGNSPGATNHLECMCVINTNQSDSASGDSGTGRR